MRNAVFSQKLAVDLGDVQENRLSQSQLDIGGKLIEEEFLTTISGQEDRLIGCMLKAFLRLPFANGNIELAISNVLEAKYTITNEKVDQNGLKATSDLVLGFGGLPSDGWAVSRVVQDSLKDSQILPSNAEAIGKQMAMLIYGVEKVTDYKSKPFLILEEEFRKLEIPTFKSIQLFEFAGRPKSVVANIRNGLGKLFGHYVLHTGAGGESAEADCTGFVTLDSAHNIVPQRNEGIRSIIARNVFNKGAVGSKIDPISNVRTLLCVFSNSLPDGGRLYISTSISDPIILFGENELLNFTGFRPIGEASYCHSGRTPSYVLERDFSIRGDKTISSRDLEAFSGNKWRSLHREMSGSIGVLAH